VRSVISVETRGFGRLGRGGGGLVGHASGSVSLERLDHLLLLVSFSSVGLELGGINYRWTASWSSVCWVALLALIMQHFYAKILEYPQ
jgi:hypothetical protein